MQVTDVRQDGDGVIVEFDDGHKAGFTPYRHGLGYQVEGLKYFVLYRADGEVARYASRLHRAGPCEDECRFVHLTEGYTPELVAEYWQAARTHINDEYFEKPYKEGREHPENLWYAWKVAVTEGGMDLDRLKNGRVPLPS